MGKWYRNVPTEQYVGQTDESQNFRSFERGSFFLKIKKTEIYEKQLPGLKIFIYSTVRSNVS